MELLWLIHILKIVNEELFNYTDVQIFKKRGTKMSKREEEMINEALEGLFNLFSDVPVKVVTVGKSAINTTEKTAKKAVTTAKKVVDSAKECAACRKNYEPKLTDFVDNVICQDSAVVIFWKDGTKTTAKCGPDDVFDYEKGLAIAALKYVFGNKVYQEDMKEIMEAFPRTKSTAKKKAVKPVAETTTEEPAKKSSNKSTSKSASKSTSKKSSTTKKSSSKKSSK